MKPRMQWVAVAVSAAVLAACGGGGAVVDAERRLVTTPAYMLDSPISEVSVGIEKLVAELLAMVRR